MPLRARNISGIAGIAVVLSSAFAAAQVEENGRPLVGLELSAGVALPRGELHGVDPSLTVRGGMTYRMHPQLSLVLFGRYTGANTVGGGSGEGPLSFAAGEDVRFIGVGLGFRGHVVLVQRLSGFAEMTIANVILRVGKPGVDFEERGLGVAGRGGLAVWVMPKMDLAAVVGLSRCGFEFEADSAAATWATGEFEARFYW